MKSTIILWGRSGFASVRSLQVAQARHRQKLNRLKQQFLPPSRQLSTSAVTVISTPLAVETLPLEQFVDINVEKERPDATIHLLYNGGKGEIFVQNIMMRVTRSDGTG